jgi:N-acetylglucosaminyl-diphospho-decaprenol L-rhamnosyltransferase
LNPDTEIVEGTLAALVAELDLRPEVGLAGVRHLTGDRELFPTMRRFPNALRSFGQAFGIEKSPLRPSWLGERELKMEAYGREMECDWTTGAFMIARREALDGAGCLDERFFIYSEETDLCLRIKRAGWDVHHLPTMTIIHHAGKAGVSARMEAQNAYARMQFAAKHFSPVHRGLYRLALVLGYAVRVPVAMGRRDKELRRASLQALATLFGRRRPPFGEPPRIAVQPRNESGELAGEETLPTPSVG